MKIHVYSVYVDMVNPNSVKNNTFNGTHVDTVDTCI